LKEFSQKNNLRIVEAALAGSTGELEIRIENSNRGNSSFLASAIPASEFLRLNVRTISVQDFVKNHIPNADYFVLKSDVQGYDSKILGLLPSELWEKCVAAVVEVWALREIEPLEVENLLILWRNFSSVSWTADRDRLATLEEVHDFWLGKSGKSRNLYLSQ
jgi:FkbM family methyltransferase